MPYESKTPLRGAFPGCPVTHVIPFCIFLCALLFFAPEDSLASKWYVSPRTEVPIRSGLGSEYRIVAIVQDGTRVELLQESDDWAMVRLDNEKEGWILRRFLGKEQPLKEVVASLKGEKAHLRTQLDKTSQEARACGDDLRQCQDAQDACMTERDKLSASYQELQHDAADVLSMKAAYEQAQTDLQKVRQQLTLLEQENRHLKTNDRIKWFMAGGGVLLAGWLIGMVMGRGRRRRPSLL